MTPKLIHPLDKEYSQTSQLPSLRIKINDPFESEMTLVHLDESNLGETSRDVLVENIGPGGLRFVSNLKLEVEQEMIYSFDTEVIDDTLHLPGVIIWKEELSKGLFQYGVHFRIPESTRSFLVGCLPFPRD
ncbi:MAG: PilZ domain-containing protein [Bacillus sp. (in: firmicutes)]